MIRVFHSSLRIRVQVFQKAIMMIYLNRTLLLNLMGPVLAYLSLEKSWKIIMAVLCNCSLQGN